MPIRKINKAMWYKNFVEKNIYISFTPTSDRKQEILLFTFRSRNVK